MGPSLSQVLPKKQNTMYMYLKQRPRNDNQSESNKIINFVDAAVWHCVTELL